METVGDFLKKSKRRFYRKEGFQPHSVPRLNLHVDSNSLSANNVLEDILTSVHPKGYVSTFPIPVGRPVKVDDSIVKGVDPVLKLVKDKRKFKAMYQKVRQSKHIKDLTLEDIENLHEIAQKEPGVDVHPSILAFAQVCSLDPDPDFSCNYNYYYGGDVAVTELQGRMTIVHTVQDKPSKLRVVIPEFDEESSFDVSHVNHHMQEIPIYQVDCFSNLILLRQKKSCGLLKFNCDEGTRLDKIAVVNTPHVFMSSSFNMFKQDEFATVSPNLGIEIHDVHGKCKRSVEVEGVKDKWGHVHYHDQNVLIFCDRDSVSLCDLRESGSESLQWEVKNQTEICDDVFSAAKGKFLHYVCTKHYLLSLDIREGFHQRWAHGLSNAPSLLNVVPNGAHNDAVLIGCQSSGGIVYVQNSSIGNFTSDIVSPPIRLPSPRETLHSARTQGCLLSPIISSRFALSLTGLTSFKSSKKMAIFSCNSVGDLFAQSIGPNEQCDSAVEPLRGSDLERLHLWESRCLRHLSKIKHDFQASSVVSSEHLVHLFDDTSELTSCERTQRASVGSTSPRVTDSVQPWNKSKKCLLKYQDVLAPKLLAHWNIDELDEWCDVDDDETINESSMEDDCSDEQDDVDARVQKWLDACVEKSSQEPTDNFL